MQPADAHALFDELLQLGLEKWWPNQPSESGLSGVGIFKTFKHAFQVLIKGSSIKSVTFQHRWYSDWSWVVWSSRTNAFFDDMDKGLNDDCIREIIKYIDIPHRIYFASISERFGALTLEISRDLRIYPSTVGMIGLMNFRYLMETFGSSVINLSVSLTSFSPTLGFYFSHIKTYILDIISLCTGPKLRAIHLCDFNWSEEEEEKVGGILQMFAQRGVEFKLS